MVLKRLFVLLVVSGAVVWLPLFVVPGVRVVLRRLAGRCSGPSFPGELPAGWGGVLRLYVYDIGGGSGNGEGITLVNRLPEGVEAIAE